MSLMLHMHPLCSFCWKVLVALYDSDIPFEAVTVNLGDPESRAAFEALWPMAQMPVLQDHGRKTILPETSIIVEYLAQHYPAAASLIPTDPELSLQTRLRDRFFDLHVQQPMQKIVTDRIRPNDCRDPYGVAQARTRLATALGLVDIQMHESCWAMGERFTLADCAAAPALYYANLVTPLAETWPCAAAYLERLKARPSFARTLREAEPWLGFWPRE